MAGESCSRLTFCLWQAKRGWADHGGVCLGRRFNDEIGEVVAALADGPLFVDPVVTHTFPLDQGLEAFEMARNAAVSGRVLLDFRPGQWS
ncbi:threonine dehydrogenase-like Zn-dependent dehydrogenase [Arthrobacter sp. UYEF36]